MITPIFHSPTLLHGPIVDTSAIATDFILVGRGCRAWLILNCGLCQSDNSSRAMAPTEVRSQWSIDLELQVETLVILTFLKSTEGDVALKQNHCSCMLNANRMARSMQKYHSASHHRCFISSSTFSEWLRARKAEFFVNIRLAL